MYTDNKIYVAEIQYITLNKAFNLVKITILGE